jgi:hypothetical protein
VRISCLVWFCGAVYTVESHGLSVVVVMPIVNPAIM